MSTHPDEYDDIDDYAAKAAQNAIAENEDLEWSIGGGDTTTLEFQYSIEPGRGSDARGHSDELAEAILELPNYRDGACILVREITCGPWRYVTPEEIRNA
jgi:hypothetical protein